MRVPGLVGMNPAWHAFASPLCLCRAPPLGSCNCVCVYLLLSLLKARRGRTLAIWSGLLFCVCLTRVFKAHTWLMSLVHAAFSCRDGASKTTVKGAESDGSTTSLKSSWPNTWPPALAASTGKIPFIHFMWNTSSRNEGSRIHPHTKSHTVN